MSSGLTIEYHVEEQLPAGAVALVESTCERIDVYVSAEYPREVVADHLGPLATAYCEAFDMHPLALIMGSG